MKDIFDNELDIGDVVAFNPPQYKGLVKGQILRFGEKTVRVKYDPVGKQHTSECSVYPRDVVKK